MVASLECWFPALRGTGYEVTSPESSGYNCIAWAAGASDRWWQPDPLSLYYWPEETREWSVHSLMRVFRSFGYEVCDKPDLEPGFEKVAIYVKDSIPTHMARQLRSGEWTSKCGKLEDLIHPLGSLEGDRYGEVAVVMKRRITDFPGHFS